MTGGEIRIAGRRVNDLHPSERDIAMVFQSYALYPNMTVAGNIAFGMEMRKRRQAGARRGRAKRSPKLLQIEHLLERKPAQLSGGQRQRVAMGRALVREPQLFLFDEPLSNLDAKLRVDMRTEIKKLHQRLKATIVYVTHDQIEAMTLATRIAVMKDGVLQQLGTPSEIYNRPGNTLRRRLHGLAGDEPRGRSCNKTATDSTVATGRERPVDALVEVTEPTGADTLAVLSVGGREVTARLRPDTTLKPGDRGRFAVDLRQAGLLRSEDREAASREAMSTIWTTTSSSSAPAWAAAVPRSRWPIPARAS